MWGDFCKLCGTVIGSRGNSFKCIRNKTRKKKQGGSVVVVFVNGTRAGGRGTPSLEDRSMPVGHLCGNAWQLHTAVITYLTPGAVGTLAW